ncbi:MAG: hypothetical protein ABIG88_02260, partial [Patescibacteria group bacterium]
MFKPKTKQCQNCNIKFTIEPEDFEFYKKIDVPEPTFCPECRMKRRMNFRNESNLYKRKCDFSGKEIIAIYPSDASCKVYDQKIWNSDKWNPMEYGKDYDFDKPFFEQYRELIKVIPWPSKFFDVGSVDCDYCVGVLFCKNCYLCLASTCEDCLYLTGLGCNNCADSFLLSKSENCYENIDASNNYNIYFSQYADNCFDSSFLYNCRNCQSCFGCVNLRNKKYHIFNKPYSKEEYQKEIKKYYIDSYTNLEKIKKQFNQFRLKFPHRFANIYHSENIIGHNIKSSKNCYYCFDSLSGGKNTKATDGIEDCKYIFYGGHNLKDSYDVFDGGTNASFIYESVTAGLNTKNIYFSVNVASDTYNVQYSNNCHSCSDLFGCIGLRHKQYCVLNKQYTKESFNKLRTKIIKHMNDMSYTDKKGRIYKYGEFFPPELSPFGYNETIANEYFPLTKEQAIKQGYNWYDKPKSQYQPTIKANNLPDNIKDVD